MSDRWALLLVDFSIVHSYLHTLPHFHKVNVRITPHPHIYVNVPPLTKDTPRASLAPTIFKLSDNDNADTEARLREEEVRLQWRVEELQQQKLLKEERRLKGAHGKEGP